MKWQLVSEVNPDPFVPATTLIGSRARGLVCGAAWGQVFNLAVFFLIWSEKSGGAG